MPSNNIQTGITKCQFHRSGSKGNILGYAIITFKCGGGELQLRNFSIVKNSKDNNVFVSWPSKKVENPKPGQKDYLNTVFYGSEEYRDAVNDQILDEWEAFDQTAPAFSPNTNSGGGRQTYSNNRGGSNSYNRKPAGGARSTRAASSLDDNTSW